MKINKLIKINIHNFKTFTSRTCSNFSDVLLSCSRINSINIKQNKEQNKKTIMNIDDYY